MYSFLHVWFDTHHLPLWLIPDYWMCAGVATTLAFAMVWQLARRDGANTRHTLLVLLTAYACAVGGGFVFEWLRVLPEALMTFSLEPFFSVGRAAYGGLLFALLGAVIVNRALGESSLAFLDRAAPGVGLAFGFVRVGCFIAGCDYGVPTSAAWAVRFPSDSLAAMDHASRGWVMEGMMSLPVHPTQLYEALFGFVSCLVAWAWLHRHREPRNGSVFNTWLAAYALARFCIEFLRGDVTRGSYGALSTAQLVSLAILAGLAIKQVKDHRLSSAATAG